MRTNPGSVSTMLYFSVVWTTDDKIHQHEYFKIPPNADQSDPVISALTQQAYLRLVVNVLQSITV